MSTFVSHIALFVPDLQEAEKFYRGLFDMDLIGREMEMEDGLSYTLPFDKGWDDARAAGLELNMLALRKDGFVLALFKGEKPLGQVYVIGLGMSEEEISSIHSRIPPSIPILQFRQGFLEFMDPYQIIWQIGVNPVFRVSGDFADRWIEL